MLCECDFVVSLRLLPHQTYSFSLNRAENLVSVTLDNPERKETWEILDSMVVQARLGCADLQDPKEDLVCRVPQDLRAETDLED